MATENRTVEGFGDVSKLKGRVFEALSLTASVIGILALAVLLVYVTIDAFDLASASDEWFLSYFLTLVVPVFAFLLYSADDRQVTKRTLLGLGGGMVAVFGVFQLLSVVGLSVPRLSWPLAYMFVVAVPIGSYTAYAGLQRPLGAVGMGLLGRIVGGMGIAVAITALFVLVDVYQWFLAYSVGVLPAVGIYAAAKLRGYGRLVYLAPIVGIGGLLASWPLRGALVVFPSTWLIYVWTLAVPVGVAAAALVARRRGTVAAALAFVIAVGGTAATGFGAGTLGVGPNGVVLLFVTAAVPAGLYTDRIVQQRRGRGGLLLGVLIGAGIVAGTLLVDAWGVAGPDPWLDASFVTSAPSPIASEAGLYPAIIGSIFVITMVAVLSFALGVGTAVFLEDYTADTGAVGAITRLIQVNISNLAGVPSVVYGLLGLGLFVNLLGLGFGTVVVASITLSLLILPIVVISAQEAIRSVPDDMRQASYGMGATRWQTTKNVVLPEAMPGILTGTILSLGRAIGETAPLIMIGAPTTNFSPPTALFDRVSAMPMQIYAWSSSAKPEFQYGVMAAGVVVLLVVLIGMNATAILIRNRYERSDG
ncbi:phosphate ABC transporter permease PstA [Natronomonas gomsonensis]|uniref:phosphate ABC transporter permease PstA n=1 Tax=Natronomonas gomsonensis TaxID=1046043 RepID=UPI0015BD33E8|nr:phosphate ABC transporter permease PstA [Natronomonas gomsonensis]